MKQRENGQDGVLYDELWHLDSVHKCLNRPLDEMYTERRWNIKQRKILQSTINTGEETEKVVTHTPVVKLIAKQSFKTNAPSAKRSNKQQLPIMHVQMAIRS